MFRPFVGEVMTGRIKSMSKIGMRVSLDSFFSDIFVPDYAMQDPSEWDEQEKVWVWKLEGREGDAFIMDVGEEVRFRVRSLKFSSNVVGGVGPAEVNLAKGQDCAFEIIAEVNSDGLGLTSWWQETQETQLDT